MKLTPFPELFPIELYEPILEVLKSNTHFFDPLLCEGFCISATHQLLMLVYLSLRIKGSMIKTETPGHYCAHINGWNIDLTARQFEPSDDCPKIWQSTPSKNDFIEIIRF